MFSKRSIRSRFLIQLTVASAALVFIFTSSLYFYIRQSIYDERNTELVQLARNISSYHSLDTLASDTDAYLGISIEMLTTKRAPDAYETYELNKNNKTYLILVYPFKPLPGTFLKISKDITTTKRMLERILHSIIIINSIGFVVILLYAFALSKMLIGPIKTINRRLSNMNEHLMHPMKVENLPEEFTPLGETLNRLIGRIETFIKYQKELFIGAAHELKTPLAVIKLKNQVTLIKKREPQEYIEAIKITNESVDAMNRIVGTILNIGRQEGAQLEKPVKRDIIEILRKKSADFKLLANAEQKELLIDLTPDLYMVVLQASLLDQIVQNFLQNALKFTPENKKVTIKSYECQNGLTIEVIDEGCGVDESVDLFAPFKRDGNKSGVGLGLFLAKSAAEALGAEISLKNRTDGFEGAIATITIYSKLCCPLKNAFLAN